MQKIAYSLCFCVSLCTLMVACGEDQDRGVVAPTTNIDTLLMSSPDSLDLLIQHAEFYFGEYQFDKATPSATKAFRLDSNNLEARMIYAQVLNNKPGRSTEEVITAQRHFQVILSQNPKNTRALVSLASTHSFFSEFDLAFQYINQALRIDPRCRDAYVLKGAMYLYENKVDLAKSSWETAVQQDPEFWEAYTQLGNLYRAEGDSICIEYYTTAAEIRPNDLDMMYNLAYAHQQFGHPDKSLQLYRDMLKQDSTFAMADFQQGWIKQNLQNDIDSAMVFYRAAIFKEPRFVEAWHNLGMCHEINGDISLALKSYAKALKYNPEYELSRKAADALK